jgi:glycosyltransferase involved in cell wall biosynthesis
MNILHVIASMEPSSGGPSQGIRNLDKTMRNMTAGREVVCLDSPDSPYLSKDDLKIHALGLGSGPWRYQPQLIAWLTANICRFDVVIINGLWSFHSYAAWKVIKNLKKNVRIEKLPKVLVMPHGMLDPYFQRAKERRLKAVRNWIYWKFIESKIVNDADGLLFTCETELLLARETFRNYHPKKEHNVGYGIEAPPTYNEEMKTAFKESCPGLKDGVPYLLFLSRIHSKKGIDILIKAYIDMHKSMMHKLAPEKLPKLVVAGPGLNSRFGRSLQEQLAQTPQFKGEVLFPGMLSGEAKWGAFYGCEAFILPSHQENFGIAVVEAMACGKPVLISNQVNIWREILTEGGGIIEEDNQAGIKNMLTRWTGLKAEKKAQMSKNTLEVYQNNFTVGKYANNVLKTLVE